MYKTLELLDKLKAAWNLRSDYAIAKKLGVRPQTISKYRVRGSSLDDRMSFEVAELLGLNPATVVASMNLERAERQHDEKLISFWQQYAA